MLAKFYSVFCISYVSPLQSHMQLIDGNKIAAEIYAQLKVQTATNPKRLAILLATDNPAARTYVGLKQKQAQELGLTVDIVEFPATATADEIFNRMNVLAADTNINGIMVQLPLYPNLQSQSPYIVNLIPPEKDVDGLTAFSQGSVSQNLRPFYYPATVVAIMECLRAVIVPTANLMNTDFRTLEPLLRGRQAVVVNHSNLVGKPLAAALTNLNATVTIVHEFTANLGQLTQTADILISATGKPGLITAEMVKQGSIVIDVTSVRTEQGIQGDVALTPELQAKVAYLTPVPGGVGPLTVACLMRNLVLGYNS
jgi:methylenetetrahydrofolate dehydrogenase (NADP+)/methenyltetrahydrofolate cyclohydrolase